MRELLVPAGERREVLRILSSSLVETVRFSAGALDGAPPEGIVEIRQTGLALPRSQIRPLATDNAFTKPAGAIDYRIAVTPARDTRIAFESRHFQARHLLMVLGAVAAIGLASGLAAFLGGA
ncbi:hypothetical protein LNKW23_36750 [Paralimibaculum aggregatum]|uniref:Uncharacterized protein n=1 Tax=Paralimibaculum aggregatum TaxID=3036245 RepID=A0ABQ6LPP3_9RHOB|nr:hypothetical protein [Limibaculum sp. NKW23]GMG84459.1 hypothetical protein LNKW23_36750 [Limibaculum sp. NKW23]